MNFGQALEYLKGGEKVARRGWNGRGMWLVLVRGGVVQLKEGTPYHRALNGPDHGQSHVAIGSHIDMKTADGSMQPGWLASQADMLAEDWYVEG